MSVDVEERLRTSLDGRYAVHRRVGAGATATVYLATELQYCRQVAIKVLRHQLAGSSGGVRFSQEIRVAARLVHPHILPLLDSGEIGDAPFYVMPYVDGESLRDRLARDGPLSLDDALTIASHVASALDHAHQQGIVHRDIKPENILLQRGASYVADFGLALALTAATDNRLTESSMAIGTPRYMSPEQASGASVIDARTDVYSLGCVVYEMLAGEPPHSGQTLQAVIARILTESPLPLRALRDGLPAGVGAAVMKALMKAPVDRFLTAGAFVEALTAGARGAVVVEPDAGGGPKPRRLRTLVIGATTVAALGVASLATRGITARTATSEATAEALTFAVPPPTGVEFAEELRDVSAIAPDGRDIVFAGADSGGRRMLWIRSLSSKAAQPIPGTEAGYGAFWSPDGKSIGFFQAQQLRIVDRVDGSTQALVPMAFEGRGGSWGDDGTILFASAQQSGIFATSRASRTVRQLTSPSSGVGEIGHMWPQMLPGSRAFLYFVASAVDSVRGIYAATIDAPRGRRVVGSLASGIFANDHLLYVRDGGLVAQPFDVRTLTVTGEPRRIADSVAVSFEYYGAFSASRNDRLLYASGRSRDISRLQWMDSTGAVRGSAYGESGYIRNPIVSPDGHKAVFETYQESNNDLRIVDLRFGTVARLGIDSATQALTPVWAHDSKSVAYVVEQPGRWTIRRKAIDRLDGASSLASFDRYTVLTDWSPDGRVLLVTQRTVGGDYDLIAVPVASSAPPVLVAGGPGHQGSGRFSRDGKFVAYLSTQPGEPTIVVEPFPATGVRCQISSGGGWQPIWGRQPGRLHYLSPAGILMAASLSLHAQSPCPTTAPRALFQTPIRNPAKARSHFDVSPIDGRFLVNAPLPEPSAGWLTVVVNWTATVPTIP